MPHACRRQDVRFSDDDVDEVLDAARKLGVTRLAIKSTGAGDWSRASTLAARHAGVLAPSYGVHPWAVSAQPEDWADRLSLRLQQEPRAGVGEVGPAVLGLCLGGMGTPRPQQDVAKARPRCCRYSSACVWVATRRANWCLWCGCWEAPAWERRRPATPARTTTASRLRPDAVWAGQIAPGVGSHPIRAPVGCIQGTAQDRAATRPHPVGESMHVRRRGLPDRCVQGGLCGPCCGAAPCAPPPPLFNNPPPFLSLAGRFIASGRTVGCWKS